MTAPPEIYTGAQFTLRYGDTVNRITDYYEWTDANNVVHQEPFGVITAMIMAGDSNIIDPAAVPRFVQMMMDIQGRFNVRNWYKELSAETPDRWMDLCMQLISEIAEKYEDVLTMQASTGFDVTNPDKESRIIEYGHVINGQVQDTPYGQLDASSDYVSGRTAEQHSGQDSIKERNELDAEILSRFRKEWETTAKRLVEEFDVLFIRITGADFVA